MLSYNLTSKFNSAELQIEFPLVGATFANNIRECDNFSPAWLMNTTIYVSVGAAVLIIIMSVIIVCLVRKLAIKDKIILKYEEIQSRPQY